MAQAPNTQISIVYEGTDISREISPNLLSFTFTDNSGGKADDISLQLHDSFGIWLKDWLPSKGDTLTASITKNTPGQVRVLPCGTFSIDQIEYSCPPSVFTLKGVSAAITKQVSQQKHTRFWENVRLSEVVSDIAGKNGLKLFMDSLADGSIERIDQIEQSDLEFLKELCADYGQSIKIQADRLIVYDLSEYEGKDAITYITKDDVRLLSAKFTSKAAKTYRKAHVIYHDPLKDEDYEAEIEDDDIEGTERELEICERAESQKDAERIAEQRLNTANRNEITGSLSMVGDVNMAAGLTIELAGFGLFSGKHFINKATHKIDQSGYTTTLELGFPKEEKGKSREHKQNRKGQKAPQEIFYEGDRHY